MLFTFQTTDRLFIKPLSTLPLATNKKTSLLTALSSPSRRNRSHDYPRPSITSGCGRTPGSACWELWFTTILRPIPGSQLYLSPFHQSADNSQLIVLICVARSATISLSGCFCRPPPHRPTPVPFHFHRLCCLFATLSVLPTPVNGTGIGTGFGITE